jgi:hypothetical protein
MRAAVSILLLLACGAAVAASQRDLQRAAADDQLLASAGVEPAQAEMRLPCSAAVLDSDDGANSFECVYVQTKHDLNLLSLEDGYLMPELQLTLANMDGVALQRMGKYAQVQIFTGNRVAALSIHNETWYDAGKTEAVYQWLVIHGVAQRAPRAWIGR